MPATQKMAEREDLSGLRLDRNGMDSGLRRRRVWVPILILVGAAAAILIVARVGFGGPALETLTVPPPARPQRDVLLTATGYVVARRTAAVGPKISGRLEFLGVEEGSAVRRGEVIGRLESSDLRAAVAEAEARIEAARADLAQARAEQIEREREQERQAGMLAAAVTPRAAWEAAEAAAEAGRARVVALEKRVAAERAAAAYARAVLGNASVVAPFDGVVLTKDAEVGESVAPAVGGGGTTRGSMVTMADMDSLEVEADVSESNIARLRLGMPAEIVLDAFPDRPYPASLHQIVPTADRQKATVQVKVRFAGEREGALPEMSARVNFLDEAALARPGPREVITLPASALRRGGPAARGEGAAPAEAGWVVLRVEEGRVSETAVELARPPEGGQAEIAAGLQGGEEILLSPPADLKAGERVRVAAPGGR